MKALFPTGKLPPHSHTAESSAVKMGLEHTLHLSPEDIIWMCNFLKADYVCFDYPLPKECQREALNQYDTQNEVKSALAKDPPASPRGFNCTCNEAMVIANKTIHDQAALLKTLEDRNAALEAKLLDDEAR